MKKTIDWFFDSGIAWIAAILYLKFIYSTHLTLTFSAWIAVPLSLLAACGVLLWAVKVQLLLNREKNRKDY